MAGALSWVRPSDLPASSEQDTYTVLRDVDWERYLSFAQGFNRPGQRITYCEGVLEFMNPSRLHERHKSTIARLIELHAFAAALGHLSQTPP